MWSHCRFKDGSRGFVVWVVGGFPNFSPAIFTQNNPNPNFVSLASYLIYRVINGLGAKLNIYR